jgi:ribonuclease E/ribonuclease G
MAGSDEILYAWGPGESRLALKSGGQVVEIAVARPDLVAGAVFLGRVAEVVPALDAAFVDLGGERPGFLPGAAALGLSRGQALPVQVRADAHGAKGPTLTAELSLAGRWLAYAPLRPGIAASRRLAVDEADRLTVLAARLVEPDEGVMLRSAAAGRGEAELAPELARLRDDWAEIDDARHAARAPALLWRPDPLARLLADHPGVARVRVDDAATFAALRRRFGALVEHQRDGEPAADIDEALAEALAAAVPLPGGGRLIVEPTAALTAIDVDSGAGRPADANRAAIDAVARQLRLRAIGGQVAVDFVSGGGKGALFKLVGGLKRAVAADPVPTHVFGVTPLGLVELTRERRSPSLADLLTERETRPTAAAAATMALRRAVAEAAHRPGRALALTVAPEVAAALARLPAATAEAETRIGRPLGIRPQAGRDREDILVEETP